MKVYKKLNSQNNLHYRVNGRLIEYKGDNTDRWQISGEYYFLEQINLAIKKGLLVPTDIQEPKLEEVDW